MHSVLNETQITQNELAHEQGVSLSTVSRWALRGVRGHRLEIYRLGGRVITSREAFERWCAKINGKVAHA